MCIDANVDTARAERMRQHAQAFKAERPGSDAKHPGFPVAPGWAMQRDDEGNVAVVPESRGALRPAGMSWRLRAFLVAMWSTSTALVVLTLTVLAPLAPKALNWVAQHLGASVAAISL